MDRELVTYLDRRFDEIDRQLAATRQHSEELAVETRQHSGELATAMDRRPTRLESVTVDLEGRLTRVEAGR